MRNLKRALSLGLTAAMISGLMVMGSSAASYADVADTDNVEAIEVLEAVGIMIGDENGDFNPDQNVTRNEMAVVMSNLMEYNVATYKGTSPFTDVPSWAEPYVAACYTNGITAGTSATTYGGDQTVTTAQAALMLMKALGYFQYSSDFGNDWQLATVAQGNKIDLFTNVNSGVKEAMSRNDVAQLVLNGLESGTVEAETNGSITVGDITIVNDVKYNFITSGQSYARAINSALNTNNDATTSTGSIVELGEKLYQGDLMKKGGQDDFGRPASTWSYNNKEIGTYADEADYTYTKSISEKDLYNELGATVVGYTWTVYYNGEILTIDKPSKNVTDTYSKTATGTLTEVFVDNVAKTVTVTMVDTFLAEVVRVQENANDVTVTLNYLSAPTNNTSRTATVTLDSTDLAVDDKVLVTTYEDGNQFSVASIVKAETVTGTVTAVKARYTDGTGKYAVMDDKQYDYVGNTFANDLADTALNDPTINAENTLYLDAYGNMIAFEATKRNVDYVYLDDAINALGGINALATFADGTSATIYVDEVDGQKKPTVNDMKPQTAGAQAYADGIYAYEKQGDAYQLITLADRNAAANSWTNLPGFDTSRNVGDVDNGASGTAIGTNYMFYSIKNGTNAIQAVTKNALVNGTTVDTKNVVSLTGSTIFVDVEGGKIYTGYTNVPTMNDITFFVVYNRQLNADVVFITDGADNSTSDSFFYVTDAKPVTTKVDGTYYYEYSVMMNNEKKTITFKGTNRDINNNAIAKDVLYKIETITPDGHVKSASPVTGFSLGYSSSVNVATYADGGTLRLIRGTDIAGTGSNNLDNNTGESIYTYNKDTQFVYIDTKLDGANTVSKSVGVGSANMINTTKDKLAGNNNVYVVAVDDKDARTPVATLVYIVEPVENASQLPTGDTVVTFYTNQYTGYKFYVNGVEVTSFNNAGIGMQSFNVKTTDTITVLKPSSASGIFTTSGSCTVATGITGTVDSSAGTLTFKATSNLTLAAPITLNGTAPAIDPSLQGKINVTATASVTPVSGVTVSKASFDASGKLKLEFSLPQGYTMAGVTSVNAVINNVQTNVAGNWSSPTWTSSADATNVKNATKIDVAVTLTAPTTANVSYTGAVVVAGSDTSATLNLEGQAAQVLKFALNASEIPAYAKEIKVTYTLSGTTKDGQYTETTTNGKVTGSTAGSINAKGDVAVNITKIEVTKAAVNVTSSVAGVSGTSADSNGVTVGETALGDITLAGLAANAKSVDVTYTITGAESVSGSKLTDTVTLTANSGAATLDLTPVGSEKYKALGTSAVTVNIDSVVYKTYDKSKVTIFGGTFTLDGQSVTLGLSGDIKLTKQADGSYVNTEALTLTLTPSGSFSGNKYAEVNFIGATYTGATPLKSTNTAANNNPVTITVAAGSLTINPAADIQLALTAK